jgi:hypothetical protein
MGMTAIRFTQIYFSSAVQRSLAPYSGSWIGAFAAGLLLAMPASLASAAKKPSADRAFLLAQSRPGEVARKKRVACDDQRSQHHGRRAQPTRQRGGSPQGNATDCKPQQPDWALERLGPESRWPLDW